MYKLYTDKSEEFVCEVQIKNASLINSIARLIVESSDGRGLIFNGRLEGNKCIIPIKRLKGMLDENTKGNIHLEIIVEDTYFRPWESNFIVEEHTSMKVIVNEQVSTKPSVKVSIKSNELDESDESDSSANDFIAKNEIVQLCEQFDITKKNFTSRRKDFIQILKEYFKVNPEYNYHRQSILSSVSSMLR